MAAGCETDRLLEDNQNTVGYNTVCLDGHSKDSDDNPHLTISSASGDFPGTCFSTCCGDHPIIDGLYPAGVCRPLKDLIRLAVPIVLTQICQMIIGPISLIFCGHLGNEIQLDGAALAICLINSTCIAIGQGLGTACDTFFSQTYGSRNKLMIGVYVQRAVLIFLLALMPAYAVHINMERFFIAVGQNPVVSKLAARYLLIFMPGGLCFFMYIIASKYVQNQNIVMPNVVIGVIANIANSVLHYVFLYHMELGTDGSAIAQSVSYFLMFILTILYIVVSGVYKETWGGWSILALQEWGKFVRICIPGMLMMCMEWWGFEIGVFLTGLLGTVELGAQSVLLQLDSIWFQIPLGVQIACAIRVGQSVGSGNALEAVTVARLTITVIMFLSLIAMSVFISFPHTLPYSFTNVTAVVDLVASLMPIVALYAFFDGIAAACKGILYGTGKQMYGAVLLFLTYYVVALPVGITLIFMTPLRSAGYWWALAGNLIIQATALLFIVCRMDWPNEVVKAMERAGILGEKIVIDPLLTEDDSGTEDMSTGSRSRHGSGSSISRSMTPRQRLLSASLSLRDAKRVVEESTEMTTGQLCVHRFGVLLIMSSILAVGIVCRIVFDVPEEVQLKNSCPNGTVCVTSSSVLNATTSSWSDGTTVLYNVN